ncbi:hypothetical protein ILUMI_11747 [Ignelater luminosus]|uniref:Protease inhibitor n=1 Tax=Ignelater luminosus TaxID=2038154 RepID=A0A8K0CZJ4_IGNLU|nr:hypothetical protein ILUMI_11747 [Ignelater luminosus]
MKVTVLFSGLLSIFSLGDTQPDVYCLKGASTQRYLQDGCNYCECRGLSKFFCTTSVCPPSKGCQTNNDVWKNGCNQCICSKQAVINDGRLHVYCTNLTC